jgi:hypothetical protein
MGNADVQKNPLKGFYGHPYPILSFTFQAHQLGECPEYHSRFSHDRG